MPAQPVLGLPADPSPQLQASGSLSQSAGPRSLPFPLPGVHSRISSQEARVCLHTCNYHLVKTTMTPLSPSPECSTKRILNLTFTFCDFV